MLSDPEVDAFARECAGVAAGVLTPFECRVLSWRFDGDSLSEIAQKVGLSRERTRQIVLHAQYKMRDRVYVDRDSGRATVRKWADRWRRQNGLE